MSKKTEIIAIIGTLDTKADEVRYIKEQIEEKGHKTIIIDSGVMGEPLIKANFPREEVAKAGGKSLKALIEAAERGADRAQATNVMIEGVKKVVNKLHSSGKLNGIFSLGGSTGTAIGVSAMKTLPTGFPKLVATTTLDTIDVGDKDITLMQMPADLLGLNVVMKKALANAAGAIVGMVEAEKMVR
jgi:uncharacterized protein (UPF0261 family)